MKNFSKYGNLIQANKKSSRFSWTLIRTNSMFFSGRSRPYSARPLVSLERKNKKINLKDLGWSKESWTQYCLKWLVHRSTKKSSFWVTRRTLPSHCHPLLMWHWHRLWRGKNWRNLHSSWTEWGLKSSRRTLGQTTSLFSQTPSLPQIFRSHS